jgi:predicted outer membrane repeat protein
LTLRGSTISDNFTPSNGGGINAQSGAVVTLLDGTVITGNTAGDGGGIYAVAGVTVTISDDSSVSGNEAYGSGDPNNCGGDGTFNGTCGP